MPGSTDTITAVATPKGRGALAIVRVSGPETKNVLTKCFLGSSAQGELESHKAYFGLWKRPGDANPIDEVVVLFFDEGRGFTGETAAEIICHGGFFAPEEVLDSILECGCRMAAPGEFTMRAVNNGKINLLQAEAILGIVNSSSPAAKDLSLKVLKGKGSQVIKEIEDELVFVLANLEASIDFVAEDISPVDTGELSKRLQLCLAKTKLLEGAFESNRHTIEGVRVALVGRPNAGKSSLLNSLVGKEKSIVTEEPGTTRDLLEVPMFLSGLLTTLVDTAGIRDSESLAEKAGIEKAKIEMTKADLVFYLVDSSEGLNNQDANDIGALPREKTVILFTKVDKIKADPAKELGRFGLKGFKTFNISVLDAQSIKDFQRELEKFVKGTLATFVDGGAITARQKEGLREAGLAIERCLFAIENKTSPEIPALEARQALDRLKALVGDVVNEEVFDKIFKEFCIGK